jgi:hypothetical protein
MGTKVRVTYEGRTLTGFVGDRGPGEPSHRGVMLDLDTYTFRHLVDGKQPDSKYDTGTPQGHLKDVKWEVLKWGDGPGKGKPKRARPPAAQSSQCRGPQRASDSRMYSSRLASVRFSGLGMK